MLFEHHQRIVFMGDSITDADRGTTAIPYGNGYVSVIRNFMLARHPEYNLTFINKGVGGDTVRRLAARWERDVISLRPNWVSVMIGANDVWRHFTYNTQDAVPLGEFETTYRNLLARAREAIKARFVLMQPFIVTSNPNSPIKQLMLVYAGVVERLAVEFSATLVRTQAAFDAALAVSAASFWSPDEIHVGQPGAALIAQAWLRAVNFEF